MINGGKQLEHNPSKHIGRHWRHFYAHYKAGTLTHEYKRVIGDSNVSLRPTTSCMLHLIS